jgi:hypothetical protein
MLTAIETTGTIHTNHQIILDEELPISEKEWLKATSHNDVFDFLEDEAEDIYTLADGKAL